MLCEACCVKRGMCGMHCEVTVCGIQCVMCSVWCEACNEWCAVCGV